MSNTTTCLVIYDISENQKASDRLQFVEAQARFDAIERNARRDQVRKAIKDLCSGKFVQNSIYLCEFDKTILKNFTNRLNEIGLEENDSIVIVRIDNGSFKYGKYDTTKKNFQEVIAQT